MTSDQVLEELKRIVPSIGHVEPGLTLSRETRFAEDLNFDSLDEVELVMECEDEFKCLIPDEDAVKLKTIGQLVDYLVPIAKPKD